MNKIFKNYKTTVPALLALVAVTLYWGNIITAEQFSMGMAVFTAAGLMGAKDIDKDSEPKHA